MNYVSEEKELNEIAKEGITIVDFYANWCGPCRMLAPILEELEEERNDVKIVKVDVDDARELAVKYKISAIPTLIVFKDGNVVANEVGFMSKDDLNTMINRISE